MSHFSKVAQADIVSEEAAMAAAKELGWTATKNAEIRGYYGRTQKADLAIKIPDYQYDIGLNKNAQGKFDVVAEDMIDQNRLGRFVQLTTKHTLINEYRRKGFVARVTENDKQELVLTLTR